MHLLVSISNVFLISRNFIYQDIYIITWHCRKKRPRSFLFEMRKCKIWQCKRMCVLYAYMGKCLNPFTMDCFLFSHPNITDIMIPLYYLMLFNLISLIKDRMLYCFGFYQRMLNLNWCTFGDFTNQYAFVLQLYIS